LRAPIITDSSIGVEGAFLNQGCYNAARAEILYEKLYINIFLRKRSFASEEILSHTASSKLMVPSLTYSVISSSPSPSNGGFPVSKI